jgi:hypothetical protein
VGTGDGIGPLGPVEGRLGGVPLDLGPPEQRHVSSPHVMWNEDVTEMWLYFHGENTTTRLARSEDGITFTYDKLVLSTSMLPSGTTETSYARSSATTCPRAAPGTSWSS